MDVTLVLVQADQKQREVPLRKPSIVIGRDVSCQIRIPTDAVSRRHCEITQDGTGLSIKDLGSSNGTFVNRRRITQSELAAGDVISVGPMVLVVRADGVPKTIDSATALSMGPAAAAPAQAPAVKTAAAAKRAPGKPSSLLDDEDSSAASKDEMEDSSLSDFDFLDDDDEKGQPKL